MIYISAQPAETYFAWQLAVQLENFQSVGIDLNDCHVLLAKQGDLPESITSLIGRYGPQGVRFFISKDEKVRRYKPSVRFALLAEYQMRIPHLFFDAVFYHDSDILFRELPDWEQLLEGPAWYCSDAKSYIGVDYIQSKGKGLLESMCAIADIDPFKVKHNDLNAGGVQYLIKKVPLGFFSKCEEDSEKMYCFLEQSQKTYAYLHGLIHQTTDYHPIQSWCADMWVFWWRALSWERSFRISPELNFTWATDGIDKWETAKIYHNAGVTNEKHLFNKTDFKHDMPWQKEISADDRYCSKYYVEAIKRTPCL